MVSETGVYCEGTAEGADVESSKREKSRTPQCFDAPGKRRGRVGVANTSQEFCSDVLLLKHLLVISVEHLVAS